MHNGYIHINNEKMSKSLGNGITVHELVKRVKPHAVRYFMLSTHYRSPLNFSDDTVAQAENSVERIANCAANLKHRFKAVDGELAQTTDNGLVPSGDETLDERLKAIFEQFHAKMSDDFNTPDAITSVFDLVTEANQYLNRADASSRAIHSLLTLLERMDAVLGLLPQQHADEELLDADIEQLIVERTEARQAKNWARADEIRDLLTEKNIVLEDTPQGIRWRRK
jgi:cysteinyl-tRNA synthetase